MNNTQNLKAYQKTQQSMNNISSSHEIIRSLIKELLNSMKKIVIDIQDEKDQTNNFSILNKESKKNKALKKSKKIEKLSYGSFSSRRA